MDNHKLFDIIRLLGSGDIRKTAYFIVLLIILAAVVGTWRFVTPELIENFKWYCLFSFSAMVFAITVLFAVRKDSPSDEKKESIADTSEIVLVKGKENKSSDR